MKIATWNLDSVKPLAGEVEEAFRRAIYAVNADVWVLTETWLNFSLVGYRLVAQTCQADDLLHAKRPFSRWVAIWSRLDARQLEVLGDPERMACIRVEQGNRPVVIVGTVLPWSGDTRHSSEKGASEKDSGGEFCRMLRIQSAAWRHLRSDYDKAGFCVAGDFNEESLVCRDAQRTERRACIHEAFSDFDCLTNNMKVVYPRAEVPDPHPTIDHICVGGGLKIRNGTQPET